MSRKYLSCAETAKLVRLVLKESFPNLKFSVRGQTYSGGASIRVEWLDGANVAQVEGVAGLFKASYFDGSIDFKGAVYHMMDGEPVRFGADFIFFTRNFSDAAVQVAIDRTYRRYAGNFKSDGIEKPTMKQYRNGDLWTVQLSGLHTYGNESVQAEINAALHKHSDRLKVTPSKTAARIFVTHDDGYSRACGSGFSAVSVDSE